MAETKPLTPSPFGPKGYVSPEESARIRSNRANAFAESILSAIRGGVKAVTTDLPGFVMDIADKIAGDAKTIGEKDRSEKMFSAVTGTSKKNEQAELVGSFVNPITAVKSIILPAALIRSAKELREATRAIDAGVDIAEVEYATKIFKLPDNIDDGKLRSILDPRNSYAKDTSPGTRALEDALHFPELYAAMPRIARTKVEFDPTVSGAYMTPWENNKITIGDIGNVNPADVLAHETQHVVQSIFNLNSGSSSEAFVRDPQRLSTLQGILNDMYTEATIAGSFDIGAQIIPMDKMLRQMAKKADINYIRTAGETEARAVELIRGEPAGQFRSALSYYKQALPDGDLTKLIKDPRMAEQVDAGVDWEKFVSTLIDLQKKIEIEKSR